MHRTKGIVLHCSFNLLLIDKEKTQRGGRGGEGGLSCLPHTYAEEQKDCTVLGFTHFLLVTKLNIKRKST